MSARHSGRQMRYYDPGQRPMPRNQTKTPFARAHRSGTTAADQGRLARAEAKRQRKAARFRGQP